MFECKRHGVTSYVPGDYCAYCYNEQEWNRRTSDQGKYLMRFQAAVAAMQGILSANPKSYAPETFAKQAVDYADALLAELEVNREG